MTTILAAQFVQSTEAGTWKPSGLTYLVSLGAKINKALSHLTYARVAGRTKWDFDKIRGEVEQTYVEFIGALPASERVKWQA